MERVAKLSVQKLSRHPVFAILLISTLISLFLVGIWIIVRVQLHVHMINGCV